MLTVENLTVKFGGLVAVDDVSLTIERDKIYGLIGPNGAGKTTFFNLVSGVYAPVSGRILFNGRLLNNMQPYKINRIGISRTYQVINLFRSMSVLDNVLVGMHTQLKSNFIQSIFHTRKERKEEAEQKEEALKWLEFVGLRDRANSRSSSLPYGDQRLLEIVRAMSSKPQLILLDEPAAGMNTAEKIRLAEIVRRILKDYKVTVLVVEHDMTFLMGLVEHVFVLNFGKKLAEGTPEEIQKNPDVITAYLGGE